MKYKFKRKSLLFVASRVLLIFILLSIFTISLSAQNNANNILIGDSLVSSFFNTTSDVYNDNPSYLIKGKPNGYWIVYEDSLFLNKIFEISYENQIMKIYKVWYKNGLIKYMYDSELGIDISWYINGGIRLIHTKINDSIIANEFYTNGLIKNSLIYLKLDSINVMKLKYLKWDTNGIRTESTILNN